MFIDKYPPKNFLSDQSLWLLLFSNIVTIFFAITENWNLITLVLVYWCQSVIIGFFNFIRILQLKEFSTKGFTINDRPVQPTQDTKFFVAFFFLFQFGFSHFIYLIFLLVEIFGKIYENTPNIVEVGFVLLTALLFFVNHLFSYLYNKPRDTKKLNIGSLMFYPYIRIIPMHLVIIYIFLSDPKALLIFLVLKTVVDVAMHIVEHKVLRKGEEQ